MLNKQYSKLPHQTLRKAKNLNRVIFKGAKFSQGALKIISSPSRKETLANFYQLTFDQKFIKFKLASAAQPQYPFLFLKKIKTGAFINAGFYLNGDFFKTNQPNYFNYHLLIINRQLISLPTKTKTALVEKNGQLYPSLIKAHGWLKFNQTKIPFIGSHDWRLGRPPKNCALAYGPANQGLIKTTRRIDLDPQNKITRNVLGYKNIIFKIITKNKKKLLVIKKITAKSVNFLSGSSILQTPNKLANKLKVGQIVTDWQIDQLTPALINSALTVGVPIERSIKKLYTRIKKEKIIITRNQNAQTYYPELEFQKARSCVFLTRDQKIHFLVIDARPKIKNQQGFSFADLSHYLYKKYKNIVWAVNCDGGQSSKLIWRVKNKIKTYGNLHYLNLTGEKAKWDGWRGRPIISGLIAQPK